MKSSRKKCAFVILVLFLLLATHFFIKRMVKKRNELKLNLTERLCHKFTQTGVYFYPVPPEINENFVKNVSVCLVHSFSPHVEEDAIRKFLTKNNDNIVVANSPALSIFEGVLVLIIRLWLVNERYDGADVYEKPSNRFSDNYFYTQTFDMEMNPLSVGRLLGIATNQEWMVGSGPIEPRLFQVDSQLYASFNSAIVVNSSAMMDTTYVWDYANERIIYPEIIDRNIMQSGLSSDGILRDKHWMALIKKNSIDKKGTFYFIQSLEPLLILKCEIMKRVNRIECNYTPTSNIYKNYETTFNRGLFDDYKTHLRGGTPFVRHGNEESEYFVTVAHSTYFLKTDNSRYYTSNFVIFHLDKSDYNYKKRDEIKEELKSISRVVYVSDDIQIHKNLLEMYPIVRERYINHPFIFAVSLLNEYPDYSIGVHINDFASVILRLVGFGKLVDNVIEYDMKVRRESKEKRKRFMNPFFINQIMAIRTLQFTNLTVRHG